MKNTAMKYGLICGLVYIAFSLFATLLSLQSSGNFLFQMLFQLLTMLATFFVIFLGVREFRDQINDGSVTVGQGLKFGVMVGLIAGAIAGLFSYIYQTFIDPELLQRTMEEMRISLEDRGMTDEQIDRTMWWTKLTSNPLLAIATSILWVTFWGFLKGVVAGAILQKAKAPE